VISAEHQRTIEAAIPAGVVVPTEFWRDLNIAIDLYLILQQRRAAWPPAKERARWQRIEKLTGLLGEELRALRMAISGEHSDALWPNRALVALWEIRYRAETNRIGYEMLGAAFKRRSNPHRDLLFAAICDLWAIHLQQRLPGYSMSDGTPCGGVIDFFAACLEPVFGAGAVPLHAVRNAIDRAHKRNG
jgi:hypothetical protein